MSKRRVGILALWLVVLLFTIMVCSREEKKVASPSLEHQDLVLKQVLVETPPREKLIARSDKKITWQGKKSYPYSLTMREWKEEWEADNNYCSEPIPFWFRVEYPSISGLGIELVRSCYITLMTEEYLSIRFDGYTASGRFTRLYEMINIDLKSGRRLELEDFFEPNTKPAELIMDYCKKDLKRQHLEHYNKPIGEQFSMLIDWQVTPETCSVVNLTQTGFFLIFDELKRTVPDC